ncbi:MAG: hypothetical protein ACM3N9_00605 [Syntrophothermus sp.]
MDKKQSEKYSSAFTLSDMEIFIFPELMYALVLANIMSPEIWKWKDDPWFSGITKMGPLKKMHRLKQFIMDHYNFNLDLETWGLTDKQTEIDRFKDFIDPEIIQKSNALFGYEGDKYYFSMDIRKHFGLDNYNTDVIPYWKTETVEAMNAFRFKEGYPAGAGECVSLACLYAAALYVVAEVPLENIFLMGTPLHSQNFVMTEEGVLTNNRRIVTKAMWYNGTELSALARRALEHEHVTLVAHLSGYIHAVYHDATIDEDSYTHFKTKLEKFLTTGVNYEIFINFLRYFSKYQKLFQLRIDCQGNERIILLEKAFGYEHGSKNRLGDDTARKLYCEMDEEDFLCCKQKDRIMISPENPIFHQKKTTNFIELLQNEYPSLYQNKHFINDFRNFIKTKPKLPVQKKKFLKTVPFILMPGMKRAEIISRLSLLRKDSVIADLAFYAGRFMDVCEWEPFLKAAYERNPVTVKYFEGKDLTQVYKILSEWSDESIYDGNRLAQPDEVVNYFRGDGMEKAITFMNVLRSRKIDNTISQKGNHIKISAGKDTFTFITVKDLVYREA